MKNKGKLSTPSLLIIGIIAIVAVVTIISGQTNLEGAPVYNKETVTGDYQKYCSDDDPNNDHYFAGIVKVGRTLFKDHCRGDNVYQYYCRANDAKMTKGFKCPNGCLAGACN